MLGPVSLPKACLALLLALLMRLRWPEFAASPGVARLSVLVTTVLSWQGLSVCVGRLGALALQLLPLIELSTTVSAVARVSSCALGLQGRCCALETLQLKSCAFQNCFRWLVFLCVHLWH